MHRVVPTNTPQHYGQVDYVIESSIDSASLGWSHCSFLTHDQVKQIYTLEQVNPIEQSDLIQQIQHIYSGPYHTTLLMTDGSVFQRGLTRHLAIREKKDEMTQDFVKCDLLDGITVSDIYTAANFTLFLTNEKKLFLFGEIGLIEQVTMKKEGLDVNDESQQLIELTGLIPDNDTVEQVAVGGKHAFILTEKQRLFCFGQNNWMQLGLEDNAEYWCGWTENTFFSNCPRIRKIVLGFEFSSFMLDDGSVYVCGRDFKKSTEEENSVVIHSKHQGFFLFEPTLVSIDSGVNKFNDIFATSASLLLVGQDKIFEIGNYKEESIPTICKQIECPKDSIVFASQFSCDWFIVESK